MHDEIMEYLKPIAAGIFARRGIPFEQARRAGGWTNVTWIAGGLALRMSVKPGSDIIRREARLVSLLPTEVGYPTILETGLTGGHEWSLMAEIPGACLGEVWDNLSWAERTSAVCQMWEKAQVVHRITAAQTSGLARARAWFNSNDPAEAEAGLSRLVEKQLLAPQQAAALREILARFWPVLSTASLVLNHGDLTLDNAMWHAGRVVALLDFEYSLTAPAELDLNTLLKNAFAPEEGGEAQSPADLAGREDLRRAAARFARPVIDRPGGRELLLGYAVLLELFLFELWLANPDGEGPLETWSPYRRLLSLAGGNGGYLRPVLS